MSEEQVAAYKFLGPMDRDSYCVQSNVSTIGGPRDVILHVKSFLGSFQTHEYSILVNKWAYSMTSTRLYLAAQQNQKKATNLLSVLAIYT